MGTVNLLNTELNTLISRTILTGVGYLEGNWKVYRDRTAKINMIEPVLEGVMQLFFQSIILYIVYGPGTSRIGSNSFLEIQKVKLAQLNFDFLT